MAGTTHTEHQFDKSYKTVIGIDQSITHTGIVVIRDNKIVLATGIKTDNKNASIEERIHYIKSNITEVCDQFDPEFVCIEGLAYGISSNNGKLLSGLFFTILTFLIDRNIPYKIINPKTLKKDVTESGSASKEEMFLAIDDCSAEILRNLSGLNEKNKKFEDIVDAYWLVASTIRS